MRQTVASGSEFMLLSVSIHTGHNIIFPVSLLINLLVFMFAKGGIEISLAEHHCVQTRMLVSSGPVCVGLEA